MVMQYKNSLLEFPFPTSSHKKRTCEYVSTQYVNLWLPFPFNQPHNPPPNKILLVFNGYLPLPFLPERPNCFENFLFFMTCKLCCACNSKATNLCCTFLYSKITNKTRKYRVIITACPCSFDQLPCVFLGSENRVYTLKER